MNTASGRFTEGAAAWEVDTSEGFGATSIPYACGTCPDDDTPQVMVNVCEPLDLAGWGRGGKPPGLRSCQGAKLA